MNISCMFIHVHFCFKLKYFPVTTLEEEAVQGNLLYPKIEESIHKKVRGSL